MSVRIRLRRVGRKKQPYFRVVVTKGDAPRDGAYIEELGFYNPRTRPAFLTMDLEKVDDWIGKGAAVSDSAMSLIRKARKGGDDSIRFTAPGEALPNLKTATKPERRPAGATASPATEPEGEPAEKTDTLEGAQPDAEKEEPAEAVRGGDTAQAVAATETEAPKSKVAETDAEKTAEDAPPTEAEEEPEASAEEPEAEVEEPETEAEEPEAEAEEPEGKAEVKAAVESKSAEEAEEPEAKTEAQAEAETESEAEVEEPKAKAKSSSKKKASKKDEAEDEAEDEAAEAEAEEE